MTVGILSDPTLVKLNAEWTRAEEAERWAKLQRQLLAQDLPDRSAEWLYSREVLAQAKRAREDAATRYCTEFHRLWRERYE